MFNLLLALFGTQIFADQMGWGSGWQNSNTSPAMGYKGHFVSDQLLNLKFQIEENSILKKVAYQDAVGVWTIGIGLVDIFDASGKYVLKVYKGLTLDALKAKMGQSQRDDLAFTFDLMRNHVKRSSVHKVFADLDNAGVVYNSKFADALCDFYYNSGSAYGKPSYYAMLTYFKSRAGRVSELEFAMQYVKYRLSYLESWSAVIYGSWLRRVQIFADRIIGVDMDNKKSWAKYPTSVSVRSYVMAKYFYSLKKPLK